jgi:AraC-like DNA-binding protein
VKFSRIDESWQVISDDRILHHSLEMLAYKVGYRVVSVCEELGISEQHFRRVFRRDVGVPVKEWMNSERMVVARRKLQAGDRAEDVSKAVGFANLSSFRRAFSGIYGVKLSYFQKQCEMRARQCDSKYGDVS